MYEIAEVAGKQHGNVVRDIEKVLAGLGKPHSIFGAGYLDGNGQERCRGHSYKSGHGLQSCTTGQDVDYCQRLASLMRPPVAP